MSRRVALLAACVATLALARVGVSTLDVAGAASGGAPFLARDPDDVARVVLSRGGAALELARGPAGWVVRTPRGDVRAREGVDALVERIRAWRRERLAGADPALHAGWSVDEASARAVRLVGADGAVLADLLVGRIAGIELEDVRDQGAALDTSRLGLLVRARGDDRTWFVRDFVTRELEPDPRAWFVRPFAGLTPEAVRRLTLAGAVSADVAVEPGRPIRFEADPRPVDAPALQAFLSWLRQVEVTGPGAADHDASPAAVRLVLELAGDDEARTTLRADLAPRARGWTLRVEGEAFELDAAGVERALAGARGGLVRRRLLPIWPRDVRRLEWSAAAGAPGAPRAVALARAADGVGWEVPGSLRGPAGAPRPVAPARVEAALEALLGLHVTAWTRDTGPSALELAPGREALVVTTADGTTRLTLEPGAAPAVRGAAPGLLAEVEAGVLARAREAVFGLME